MSPSSGKDFPENKHAAGIRIIPCSSWLILLGSALLWFFLLSSHGGSSLSSVASHSTDNNAEIQIQPPQINSDRCSGRYVYVQRIPSKFNADLLKNCSSLIKWIRMCRFIVNSGFGPPLTNLSVFSGGGWYWTNQFSLEIIFHERMKRYECLTGDSSKASAIYVPYYAGLEVSRYLWDSDEAVRDAGSLEVVRWLRSTPEWRSMRGRDHFLIAGRVAWDFRRKVNNASDWGNRFMLLPESNNMTVLSMEASTDPHSTDLSIPYPSWFHPSGDGELRRWQNVLRQKKRPYLFSFAGAARPQMKGLLRNELIDHCRASPAKCKLFLCELGMEQCDDPESIMKLFQSSNFCLQPPGDTLTRRSIFDCMIAGCIPVFFNPRSAYLQYRWHFPDDYSRYSVFMPMEDVKSGKINVEKELSAIPTKQVEAMREEVLKLIPNIVYADHRSKKGGKTFEDAFDLTLKGILEKIDFRRDPEDDS